MQRRSRGLVHLDAETGPSGDGDEAVALSERLAAQHLPDRVGRLVELHRRLLGERLWRTHQGMGAAGPRLAGEIGADERISGSGRVLYLPAIRG